MLSFPSFETRSEASEEVPLWFSDPGVVTNHTVLLASRELLEALILAQRGPHVRQTRTAAEHTSTYLLCYALDKLSGRHIHRHSEPLQQLLHLPMPAFLAPEHITQQLVTAIPSRLCGWVAHEVMIQHARWQPLRRAVQDTDMRINT